jgi:glycosyltransferase involved in cell wall biosynthesis
MDTVSIIIPAYNKAELTARTVNSILKQTYPNIEIIVVDDGSTDSTRPKMAEFGGQIRYIYKKNGGACSARNVGICESQGDYIGLLDCDDLYAPQKVEKCIQYLKRFPQYGFVHTAAHFIDQDDKVVGTYSHPRSRKEGWISDRLIMGNFVCNSTIFARKMCFDRVGLFDETFFMPADWDMWIRLAEKYQAGYLNEPLTYYRVTDNYILKRIEKCQEEEEIVLNKFFDRNKCPKAISANKVYSNFHYRFAQCYFLQGNDERLKKEMILCLEKNPMNIKALLSCAYYFLARNSLKKQLEKRIFRMS